MRLIRDMISHIEAQRSMQLQSVESMQREATNTVLQAAVGFVCAQGLNVYNIYIYYIYIYIYIYIIYICIYILYIYIYVYMYIYIYTYIYITLSLLYLHILRPLIAPGPR